MRPWAEDLGYTGKPFAWDEDRRALLRAELDAFFARKYALSKDELRYILDPADVKGPDYPSETFRVLKKNEEARYGEYRTRRLVLEAWDRLAGENVGAPPVEIRPAARQPVRAGAWAHAGTFQPGDAGAVLAAILKAVDGPRPTRDIRLAAVLVLEPRLLMPLIEQAKAAEWRRNVGTEAEPLASGVVRLIPRLNEVWGAAVRHLRANGQLIENLAADTWAPGKKLDVIDTSGWPEGRAGFVVTVLGSLDIDRVKASIPQAEFGWVMHGSSA
jgi:hypothetical protein